MKEHALAEERGHSVAFFEYGNPKGEAIISFHGGPGSSCKPAHANRFDLSKYRVILFDQRGCGKSTPLGHVEANTTEDILLDTERIREKLGIESWFVSGASWGSTCSLLYALKFPKRVRGLLISAVYLGDRDSIAWSMSDPKGSARLMPDVWARRMAFFKEYGITLENQDADLLAALQKASPDEQKKITAEIYNWEGNLFSVQAPIEFDEPDAISDEDVASAKIFLHYESNREFMEENYILDTIETIAHLPIVLVHGRYDILCPLEKAYELAHRMRTSELVIATSSGHKLTAEGETIQRMAYDRFLERYT